MATSIFNKNNEATVEDVFTRFLDEVKGEIEEWSQSGSGWVIEVFSLEAFLNAVVYEPFRGGRYMPLPKSCKEKNMIFNIQNRDK